MDIIVLVAVALLQVVGLAIEQLRETVDAIKSALVQRYVDATEGTRLGSALSEELERGALRDSGDPEAFAAAVQKFLQARSRDRHLLVWHGAPVDILKIAPGGRLQGPAIGRIERRPDGVAAFVEVRHFLMSERTGGGGYSGTFARLPHGFTMFVSTGRTFDPRSGAGWQVDGIRPDREAPARDALDVALRLAAEHRPPSTAK
jgi:hypothetical protein